MNAASLYPAVYQSRVDSDLSCRLVYRDRLNLPSACCASCSNYSSAPAYYRNLMRLDCYLGSALSPHAPQLCCGVAVCVTMSAAAASGMEFPFSATFTGTLSWDR